MALEKNKLLYGSLWKNMLLFSLPLILSNLLQVLFNMSDIAVVGKFDGPIALGAVGSTATLIFLFTGFLIGLSNGVNVIVAKYIGCNDENKVKESVHTSLITCFFIGVLVMLIGCLLAKNILVLLNTKEEFLDKATLYLRIYFIGMPATAVYNYGNAVYSAAGDTKKPLYFLLAAGIVNICLNLFLVIVCKMSVAGTAIASFVSQYVAATLIIVSLLKSNKIYKLSINDLKFNSNRCKEVLILGIPAGLQAAIFAIANLFVQSAVNSLDSVMVEGNSAAMNADNIVYDVMAAFYVACASFISQNLGAGNQKRIINSYFVTLVYSLSIGLIMGALLLIFGEEFLSLFTSSSEVIDAGMKRLRIMASTYFISAFMDTAIAASRGLGKTFLPTLFVMLGSCVFRIIWIYTIFNHYQTFTALYLVYCSSWIITSFAEIIYFIIIYNKEKTTKY